LWAEEKKVEINPNFGFEVDAWIAGFQVKVWIYSKFGFRKKFKLQDFFRRTRATYLVQHDVRIEVVARLLGHANIATTEAHYAKISPEVIRKAMESTEPEGKSKEEPLWATDEDELKHLYGIR